MADARRRPRSAFLRALEFDDSLPIEPAAVRLWLNDIESPTRWSLRPLLQFVLAILLHVTWFMKRLPLPQFRAHGLLQRMICWFCTHFVSPSANQLILRHFATESNILNFLIDNSHEVTVGPLALYPCRIDDMLDDSFVKHDQELFRVIEEMGHWRQQPTPLAPEDISWAHWRPLEEGNIELPRWRTQVLDFESAHALFMCLFCLLLTREEYRDAINGFNLDQSIAIRIGQLIGDPTLAEMAYNKYPHYLVGPWNLSQRFLMHGFFTEYLYARLERLRMTSEGTQ